MLDPDQTWWFGWLFMVGLTAAYCSLGFVESEHPRVIATATALLACSAAVSFVGAPDIYPLSRYPMYSNAKHGSGETSVVYWKALTGTGQFIALPPPTSRQAALRLIAEKDLDSLTRLALTAAKHEPKAQYVAIEKQRRGITPYPEPLGVLVIDVQEVLRVKVPMP